MTHNIGWRVFKDTLNAHLYTHPQHGPTHLWTCLHTYSYHIHIHVQNHWNLPKVWTLRESNTILLVLKMKKEKRGQILTRYHLWEVKETCTLYRKKSRITYDKINVLKNSIKLQHKFCKFGKPELGKLCKFFFWKHKIIYWLVSAK